jgi:hypothetical protein
VPIGPLRATPARFLHEEATLSFDVTLNVGPDSLSTTGWSPWPLLGFAVALVLVGTVLLMLSHRRRTSPVQEEIA